MPRDDHRELLDEQIEYYRARAPEYDRWFFREGRYDYGSHHRDQWFAELAIVQEALAATLPCGEILELACGTGLWTQHLVRPGTHVVAVDASPEAIALNRARVQSEAIEYVVADLFSWTPSPGRYDAVFFGFWLSHVPDTKFDRFWETVQGALNARGTVFFVDSLPEQTSTARDQGPLEFSGMARRRLDDGREFTIVKVFHEPAALERRLRERGWRGAVKSSGRFFLYGAVQPMEQID